MTRLGAGQPFSMGNDPDLYGRGIPSFPGHLSRVALRVGKDLGQIGASPGWCVGSRSCLSEAGRLGATGPHAEIWLALHHQCLDLDEESHDEGMPRSLDRRELRRRCGELLRRHLIWISQEASVDSASSCTCQARENPPARTRSQGEGLLVGHPDVGDVLPREPCAAEVVRGAV
jgi:hypothetical protein